MNWFRKNRDSTKEFRSEGCRFISSFKHELGGKKLKKKITKNLGKFGNFFKNSFINYFLGCDKPVPPGCC